MRTGIGAVRVGGTEGRRVVSDVEAVEEPIQVRRLSEATRRAAGVYDDVVAELQGDPPMVCADQRSVDLVREQVCRRLNGLSGYERDALLVMLVMQDLAGWHGKPAISVPAELLAQRVAGRS